MADGEDRARRGMGDETPKDRGSDEGRPETGRTPEDDGGSAGRKDAEAGESAKPGGEDAKDSKGPGKGKDAGEDGSDAKEGGKKSRPGLHPHKKNDGDNPIAKAKKLLKRIKMLAKKAIMAAKALLVTKLLMTMKMLLMMMMQMMMAIVQAVAAAVMTIINMVAVALGVGAAVAATILTGGLFLVVAVVVVVVVAVTSDEAAQRSDALPECNTDASYMEVVEGIPVQAWTNAKIIYTFFKSYGESAGVGFEYSDAMVAGILGNWYHESGIDPTSVETVFDEKYGIGPKKKWLQDGYVKTKYTEDSTHSGSCCHCTEDDDDDRTYYWTTYEGTEVTPLLYDQTTTCTVFGGESTTYPVKYADGGYIGAVTESSGCGSHKPSVWSASSGINPIGYSYGIDTAEHISGPIRFNVRMLMGVYAPTSDGSNYWSKFPAIKRMGLGLGQWTDTGLDASGEPIGRAKDLLDYADRHGNDWYHVDLQLMYALSDDGRADWLQCWNDMSFQSEWVTGFTSSTGTTYAGSWTDAAGEVHDLPETANVAWCAESFARGWEGTPSGHSSLNTRIQNALMWYEIISKWNENYDYTMGTGTSLWTVAAAMDGAEGSLWHMVAGEGGVGLDLSKASRLRSCADLKFFGNSTLAEAAVSYAWGPGYSATNNGTKCWQHLFSVMRPGDQYFRSCDRTVALAVHWTGTDSNLPWGSTMDQIRYLEERAAAYKTLITSGGTMASNVAWWEKVEIEWDGSDISSYISQLRPGDVLIRNDRYVVPSGYSDQGVGHVVMYVGEETISRRWPELITEANGGHHGKCIVSGSINSLSPHIGGFSYASDGSGAFQSYYVYRNRGAYCSDADRKFINLSCVGHSNFE